MKFRYSHQRTLILDVIKKAKKHLSAEEIYELVKEKQSFKQVSNKPKLSFGTVYRNLGILEHMGEIKKFNVTSEKAVYEADTKPHHHLICKKCGNIKNVYTPANFKCVSCLKWIKDFDVQETYMNAYGICEKCRDK